MSKNERQEHARFEEVLALWVFNAIDSNVVVEHLLHIICQQQEVIRTLSPDPPTALLDVDHLVDTIAQFKEL